MIAASKKYLTDLTDSQYELISKFLPKAKSGPGKKGRPANDLRIVTNGIFYM